MASGGTNIAKRIKDLRYALVRTSIDDPDVGRDMAGQALDLGLAASVHIREVESLYIWRDEACDHPEYEIEFMTIAPCVDDLVRFIKEKHPYECAEIIKIGFQSPDYDFSAWIAASCHPDFLPKDNPI